MTVEEAEENLKKAFMREFDATEEEALAMVDLVNVVAKGWISRGSKEEGTK